MNKFENITKDEIKELISKCKFQRLSEPLYRQSFGYTDYTNHITDSDDELKEFGFTRIAQSNMQRLHYYNDNDCTKLYRKIAVYPYCGGIQVYLKN